MSGWAGFWIGLFLFSAVEEYIDFLERKERGEFKAESKKPSFWERIKGRFTKK